MRALAALLAGAMLLPAQNWSLDHLLTRPYLWGTWPSQLAWAKHAHVLGFLWNAHGEKKRWPRPKATIGGSTILW